MGVIEIKNLKLSAGGRVILDGFSLEVCPGEVHVLAGKNGAGKSSLAKAMAGCPGYEILGGDITMDGTSIVGRQPDEIARMGIFLAFQNPVAIPGVSVANFIRAALQAKMVKGSPFNAVDFYKNLQAKMEILDIDKNFSARSINDEFSGGEKKRCEILQMLMLEPKYAILDEIDSGLDIDATKIVAVAVNGMRGPNFAAIVVTHHSKLLEYVRPDFVHVIGDGKIVASGGVELMNKLEKVGYGFFGAAGEGE
ncbi:MAG: Fe-S cluster assembly ATPase SufC [Puniceicoccales bacterium]|jgi:Fe-S cluster assembly ATP-binding protein|nr:Fe-S cluster assembly ATPase SufC [Puniceicoccales bacterium]